MFIKDSVKEFYDLINGKQCLLLVNFDVDAICASKILQNLFNNDHIVYTLVPVQGITDLVRAYRDNADEVILPFFFFSQNSINQVPIF